MFSSVTSAAHFVINGPSAGFHAAWTSGESRKIVTAMKCATPALKGMPVMTEPPTKDDNVDSRSLPPR
jgi:hypothetical protein